MSIDDVTPREWDRASRKFKAVESPMEEAHILLDAELAKDMVNSPSHYTYGKVECIEAIQESMSAEAFRGYCKGAALKYLWRYERKDKSLEDLKKAQWYLNKLIEVVESE